MFIPIEQTEDAVDPRERLFRTPADVIDPALYVPGLVIGLVKPAAARGDFALVEKVEDGQITFLGLTTARRAVHKVEEIAAIRPQLHITMPPVGAYAVDASALYQDPETGLVYEVADTNWRQLGATTWAVLPFLPRLILRYAPGRV